MAQKTNAIVVLKGAGTVVTDAKRVYINNTGNPGMATAGSGDVLTGIITSLYGQGFSAFDAAVLGVYAHGLAGDIAAAKRGEASTDSNRYNRSIGRCIQKAYCLNDYSTNLRKLQKSRGNGMM